TVAPHVGQKWKVAFPPLSPVRTYVVDGPDTRVRSRGNRACTANALPVRCWHAKQWHTEIRTGSPSVSTESAPQLQAARRFMVTWLPGSGDLVHPERSAVRHVRLTGQRRRGLAAGLAARFAAGLAVTFAAGFAAPFLAPFLAFAAFFGSVAAY